MIESAPARPSAAVPVLTGRRLTGRFATVVAPTGYRAEATYTPAAVMIRLSRA